MGGSTPYEYDALGRAIKKWATAFYYSKDWQILQEAGGGSTAKNSQFTWSPVYVGARVVRDRDADANTSTNGYEEGFYAMQDANWNVTGIVDTSGAV